MLHTVLLLLAGLTLSGAEAPWNLSELKRTPASWEAVSQEPGVKAVWIAGPPYKGKLTRAFAWYGIPKSSGKVPGMVLLHGGGGTAFAEWVRMWNREGFAAIAVDTVGTVPDRAVDQPWNPPRSRHEHSGPAGWGDFANVHLPENDQWSYHAVAVSILAHSFLRSLPGVDAGHIGVTGISWGGYLTSIVVSLDHRFDFGVPVYGCGFLSEDSAWLKDFEKLGPERTAKWVRLWDPSSWLGRGRRPMFWINGTNDFAYVMPSWQKSYRLPRGERRLSLQVRMKHSHPDGARPAEIFAYAKYRAGRGAEPVRISAQGSSEVDVWATWSGRAVPVRAELCFTRDRSRWQDRSWDTAAASIDARTRRVHAKLPEGVRAFFLNLVDEHGLIVSSEHDERE